MKKHFLGLLLGLCMAALVGCGGSAVADDKDAVTEEISTEAGAEAKEDAKEEADEKDDKQNDKKEYTGTLNLSEYDQEQTEEDATKEISQSDFLDVSVETYNMNYSDDVNKHYDCVQVIRPRYVLGESSAKQYPELAKALEAYNQDYEKDTRNEYDTLIGAFEEGMNVGEYYADYIDLLEPTLFRADNKIFCAMEYYTTYTGGAHGYYGWYGITFDVTTGKKLSLSDVITIDEQSFKDIVSEELKAKYPDFFPDGPLLDDITMSGATEFDWTIDYTGIDLYFNPYAIMYFAAGAQHISLPFDKYPDIFNPEYMEVPDKYVISLSDSEGAFLSVDGDGDDEEISYKENYDDEHMYCTLELCVGNRKYESMTNDFYHKLFLVNNGSKYFVYIFHTVENDYSVLEIVDLESMSMVGEEWEFSNKGLVSSYEDIDDVMYVRGTNAFTNPDYFVLASRINVLSTYDGTKIYHVDENGYLVSDDEYFSVDSGILVSAKQNIDCKTTDSKGQITGEGVIEAGKMFRIVLTDGEGIAIVQIYDGGYETFGEGDYEIRYAKDPLDLSKGDFYRIDLDGEWYSQINGVDCYELLDGMMFAG